jgi:mono/diheme cytochrome c family protein
MKYVFVFALLTVAFGFLITTPTVSSESYASTPDAAQLYAKTCASCHGQDGRAKTIKGKLKHARDLTDSAWQSRVGDERIFNSIINGKGKMPAYNKKLSEPEIDSLVSYVRGLKK